jgi:ParB-like chromosome segregation protein Spo0J
MTEQTIEVRRLADLKRNPHQDEFFGPDDENSILELAADIEQRGLQTLPMILPDNTILSGHQRVEAFLRLGHEEIDVVVRHDLEDDPDGALSEFLLENTARRQNSKLVTTRAYLKLNKIEARRRSQHGSQFKVPRRNYLKRLSQLLGCTERNADRYMKLASATSELQQAFECGKVKLELAATIAGASPELQRSIIVEVNAGVSPKELVKIHFARISPASGIEGAVKSLRNLIGALRAALTVPSLCKQDLPDYAADEGNSVLFKNASKLLTQLERWNKAAAKRCPRDEGLFQLIQGRATRMNEEVL